MRSRRTADHDVAAVARRRLELLSAELAATRRGAAGPPTTAEPDGSGEPLDHAGPGPGPGPAAVPAESDAGTEAADPVPWPPRRGRHARRGVGVTRATAGWLHDRLPPGLQGRVRIGAAQLALVAVAAAVAMSILAWWTVQAADPGDLVPTRADTGPAGRAAPATLATQLVPQAGVSAPAPDALPSTAPAYVVVDVAGKARSPGIVRLPAGSRVVDALEAAGGARRGVDLSMLNLARILVDGEQVLVGVSLPAGVAPPAAGAPPDAAGPAALVSINRADQAALETLPGIGPVTARAILQWRADNGAFSSVDELLEVSGIGDATLADVAPYVTL